MAPDDIFWKTAAAGPVRPRTLLKRLTTILVVLIPEPFWTQLRMARWVTTKLTIFSVLRTRIDTLCSSQ